MKISEHANYLLNEYGRLQFDYAAYCKPDGESLRNEARNNLEEYIAELEEENDRLQAAWFVEETICPDGSLKPKASALLSRIAELAGLVERLIEAGNELEAGLDEDWEELSTREVANWRRLVKDWKERER